MSVVYQYSRVSIIFIVICLVLQALTLFVSFQKVISFELTITLTCCILILFLLLFSYQVAIRDGSLFISFGIGLIRREIPISIIASSDIVPNTSLTWIYDPARSHVLRLEFRGGGRVTVGIGDPKYLQQQIRGINRG